MQYPGINKYIVFQFFCLAQGHDSVIECVFKSKTAEMEIRHSYNDGKSNELVTYVSYVCSFISKNSLLTAITSKSG